VLRFLLHRLLHAALVVLLVVSICFILIRTAPGDPFFTGLEAFDVPQESAQLMRERFGYDRPIPEQYLRFVGALVRGDLGWSHSRGRPVVDVLSATLPNTLLLMSAALGVGLLFGVGVGAWFGWRGGRLGRAVDRLALATLSVPDFVVALLLALGPALAWRLFPIGGMRTEFGPGGIAGLVDVLHHLALPATALGLVIAAIVTRHQLASMRAVREAEFVRAARATGIPERRILWRHALRNSLVPVLTVMGVLLPSLVGGAVLVERVFAWPGMGRVLVDAVAFRDYPLVAGTVLVTSTGVVLATLLADAAVAWADPRMRSRL
jgi:ABC-type dipeptide/oligopeptide/nickel transport system permease component